MRVLGIDPGLASTGYGIVDQDGESFISVDFGVITTSSKTPLDIRIFQIAEAVESIINTYSPNALAIEEVFFSKNVSSAMKVAYAYGALIVVSKRYKINFGSFSPPKIKQTITGYGGADKFQMQNMVARFLALSSLPKPDHAADALAVAITYFLHSS